MGYRYLIITITNSKITSLVHLHTSAITFFYSTTQR